MEIVSQIPAFTKDTALTIGNFDGLHRGHMSLVKRLVNVAAERQLLALMVTFNPHPSELLAPEKKIRRIFDLPEIERILTSSGIDALVRLPFTPDIASMDPEIFWKEILLKRFRPKYIVIGRDHTFGRNRRGTPSLLSTLGRADNVDIEILPPVFAGDEPVSSTRIRGLIQKGRIEQVRALLGHGLFYTGTVVHGAGRGSEMGFPTANIKLCNRMIPPPGVYVSRTEIDNRWWSSISYLGRAPTFEDRELLLETYVFHLDRMLYNQQITVDVLKKLRGDMVFQSRDALIQQMGTDVAEADDWIRKNAHQIRGEDAACG